MTFGYERFIDAYVMYVIKSFVKLNKSEHDCNDMVTARCKKYFFTPWSQSQ